MKKVIRLTESDLVRIVKRVINETDEKLSISNLNGYLNKRVTKSIDELIEDEIDKGLGLLKGLFNEPFEKFKKEISGYSYWGIKNSFNFKGNKTKEREYKEFLLDYISKKFNTKLKKIYNEKNK
jgi:hypothetical protein